MTDSQSKQRSTAKTEGAATERKRGGGDVRRASADLEAADPTKVHTPSPQESSMDTLNSNTQAKFVLFNIPVAERVAGGPVMRGFLEIAQPEKPDAEPIKVQVAGWPEIARDTGREYLSLKVANTQTENRDAYTVGPFYGRLFKNATKTKAGGETVHYFGFIEDAEKVDEDEQGRGVYRRRWQLAVRAKREVSRDGRTVYINGHVGPSREASARSDEIAF